MKPIRLRVVEMRGFWGNLLGMIGKERAEALVLRTRWGIHTFGMKFPIDVVILNKHKGVVFLRTNMDPNKVFFWNPRYDMVLELPGGEAQRKGVRLGSTIMLSIFHQEMF